ncbi:GNAT family N-acetyltransferase [Hymenobacter sp. BT559]|uniref:GNAT family N-acetyltransferase n=1 Tax=Hymenobacter sp. BT559 TaxID=2795729 RepID=UPI0018EAD274|nr:GNAT family protein [Hymenobacter sp. BT559]MBJ6143053.1 GNAT family N-acetyltransferase [Hymenobacter sp. BT559]
MRREITAGPLVLRKLEAAVAPLLLEAANTSYSPSFTQFAPWCHSAYSRVDSEQFIAQCEADWQQATAFQFAILDASTGEFCGGIGLNQPNRAHGLYNLGYWVRASRQRQGIATLATRELAKSAFVDLPEIHRLELLTMPNNVASQRTALAAGATYEGLLRQRLRVGAVSHDALLFSLVRADVAEAT